MVCPQCGDFVGPGDCYEGLDLVNREGELLSAAGIGAERTVFDAALEPLGAVA